MLRASDDLLLAEGDPPSKREVLRCALHLFVRDGLCETSIRDIAKASGYTNPALYKFFEGKDALALHLFERCYLLLVSVTRESQRPDRDFESNLGALLGAFARMIDENLEAVLYVNDTLRIFWPKLPPSTKRCSFLNVVRNLLDQGVRERALRRGTDVDLALATIVGATAQVARMVYFGELKGSATEHIKGLAALFLRGVSK
jgi:AcrR family transcriptional regulator